MSVVIETTLGAFTIDLYTKIRPKTCLNFLKLCKSKYYNFALFHNVQPHFMAQTGDPDGTGRGGASVFAALYGDQAKYFEGEFLPKVKHTKRGLVSMVNVGDGLLGSQFFITLDDDLDYLDGEHCVFGEIAENGEEILEKLNSIIADEDHRPYQDVRITHTVILDDPYEDPKGLEVPPASPKPDPEMLKSMRIGADETLEDDDGLTAEELEERAKEKEAKAQATILEMIGDLPDADCAPPENVLFVCKLNPVTTDEDLEIIFARFGKVVSCEVIRDRKSGDSLQYAFVEFDNPKSCEQAYFKMDNVLIDDRRIHVDFSQSVSKFQWKGKGRLTVNNDGYDGQGKRGQQHQGGRDNLKPQFNRKRSPPRRQRSPSPPRRKRLPSDSPPRRRRRSPSESPPRRKRSRSRERRRSRSAEKKHKKRRERTRSRSSDRRKERKRRSRSRERRRSRSREAPRRKRSISGSRDRHRRRSRDGR